MVMRKRALLAGLTVVLAGCQTTSNMSLAGRGPQAPGDWGYYGGDLGSRQYSSLTQINKTNVAQLQVAWQYETGDFVSTASPLIVDGTMYVVTQGTSIAALDAATGQQKWIVPDVIDRVRGLSYWKSADGSEARLVFSKGQALHQLDAKTGQPITTFGTNGALDLRQGLGRDPEKIGSIQPITPPKIVGDVILLGSNTGEGYDGAPGDIRGVDARTGKLLWQFHTIPHPGEPGADTWENKDAWKNHGGVNNWGGMAVDEKLGLAYFGTGSSTYDFYGGDRAGKNLYANSLLALNVKTGKLAWYYQTVHHDLWDYDITSSPILMQVTRNGKKIDAVAQATKQGFVFVFDRKTGKSVFPIEERPVPKSDMPGEQIWPTQPFSTLPPFARQSFTEADIDSNIPEPERSEIIKQVRAARNEGLFTPPGLRDTVQMPGNHGGVNWGMSAAEPTSGRFYVSYFDLPAMLKLQQGLGQPQSRPTDTPVDKGRALTVVNCAICHGTDLNGGGGIPALRGVVARLSSAEVHKVLVEGRNQMPSFRATLSDADMDNVIAFLSEANPSLTTRPGTPAGQPQSAAATEIDHGSSSNGPAPAAPEISELRYYSAYGFMFGKSGYPVVTPPWTSIAAYDLNEGKILWRRPIGGVPDYPVSETGTSQSKGGLVVTEGGLVLAASAADRKIHAYDRDNGQLLWEAVLPSVPQGVPAVYSVGSTQYITVPVMGYSMSSGRGANGVRPQTGPTTNAYVTFKLPTA